MAQRLLAMADAACSSTGGDPFCTALPLPATHSAAAATAGSSPAVINTVSDICGTRHDWRECLERVTLAHESLLLLRALVASPGLIGEQFGLLLQLSVDAAASL